MIFVWVVEILSYGWVVKSRHNSLIMPAAWVVSRTLLLVTRLHWLMLQVQVFLLTFIIATEICLLVFVGVGKEDPCRAATRFAIGTRVRRGSISAGWFWLASRISNGHHWVVPLHGMVSATRFFIASISNLNLVGTETLVEFNKSSFCLPYIWRAKIDWQTFDLACIPTSNDAEKSVLNKMLL